MEKNCTSSMEDHGVVSKANNAGEPNNNESQTNKLKASMNQYKSQNYLQGEDYKLNGFSWPPRSYTCNFCKREFKCAQALGGHMNVHRRDRARLRHYSPPMELGQSSRASLNFNLQPNPNPNFLSSSSLSSAPIMVQPCPTTLPSASHGEIKKWPGTTDGSININPFNLRDSELRKSYNFAQSLFAQNNGCKIFNESENIAGLGMEMSFLEESKEDLDLELRLGYS